MTTFSMGIAQGEAARQRPESLTQENLQKAERTLKENLGKLQRRAAAGDGRGDMVVEQFVAEAAAAFLGRKDPRAITNRAIRKGRKQFLDGGR